MGVAHITILVECQWQILDFNRIGCNLTMHKPDPFT